MAKEHLVSEKKNISLRYVYVIIFLTFAVCRTNFTSRISGYPFASANPLAIDYFLLVRTVIFVMASVFVFVCMLIKRQRISPLFTAYGILIILSTVFAKDHFLAVAGCDEQFEGTGVLLSYGIAVMVAGTILDERYRENIFKTLSAAAIIIGIICLIQFFYAGQKAYATLYNSNYAGMFSAMLLPVFYSKIPGTDDKKSRVLYALAGASMLLSLVLSGARSAWAAALIVFIAHVISSITKKALSMIIVIAAGALLLLAYIGYNLADTDLSSKGRVLDVETADDGIVFTLDAPGKAPDTLRFNFEMPDDEHYVFRLFDRDGREIPFSENPEGNMYEPEDERFSDISFSIADYGSFMGFIVNAGGRDWYLYSDDDGGYYYLNGYTRPEKFVHAQRIGFKGRESFASNRGYIWSATLPLIMRRPLLGWGPDNFAVSFVQNDVEKYLKTDFPYKMFMTKPHSLYLQLAAQLGIVTVILFVFIVCMALKRAYQDKELHPLFLAIASFLLCGLFYDSTPCVTPIFCVLLGMVI